MAASEGIRFDQTEKDYIILWIMYGFSQPDFAPPGWAFKGGTCLRHCYYSGYRFSEDLDFSCESGEKGLDDAQRLLGRIAVWIQRTSGIVLQIKTPRTIPGDFQVEIPVEYSRGGPRRQKLPHVKIHLTFDEPLLTKPVLRPVKPQYSDLSQFKIAAYTKEEIVGEKMRALLQQQKKWPRPRDLFDLWFILCHLGEKFQSTQLQHIFSEKCRVREIEPDIAGLTSENLREWNKGVWENLLGAMMKSVPEFDKVWHDWLVKCDNIFR
jgi:hypothetical protein